MKADLIAVDALLFVRSLDKVGIRKQKTPQVLRTAEGFNAHKEQRN